MEASPTKTHDALTRLGLTPSTLTVADLEDVRDDAAALITDRLTLPERLAQMQADPVNRVLAAASALSRAHEEAMHAQLCCVELEDELRAAAGELV